jgi:hypothetical protein
VVFSTPGPLSADHALFRCQRPPSLHNEDSNSFDHADDLWDELVRWHVAAPSAKRPELVLDMNDPEMIFEDNTTAGQEPRSGQEPRFGASGSASGLFGRAARVAAALNPLNLSNDRFYEVPREHRQKVRQTLGQLVVQHARPAIRLQLPFVRFFAERYLLAQERSQNITCSIRLASPKVR